MIDLRMQMSFGKGPSSNELHQEIVLIWIKALDGYGGCGGGSRIRA